MIQEISPSVYHTEYYLYPPKSGDKVFFFKDRSVLSLDENRPFVYVDDVEGEKDSLLYLFCVDGTSSFLWMKEDEPVCEGAKLMPLFDMRGSCEDLVLFELFTALHLYVWYRDNKYCGRCGKKTAVGTKERSLVCECGNIIYPKIAPAVIVGVKNKDRLLMTRYANRPFKGWALIAGFCEIGETVEDTVRREVMEEAGLKVKNIRYYASQPWGVDINLLVGMYCEVDGDDAIKIDEEELAEGRWFSRDEIPDPGRPISLTATMMQAFKDGVDLKDYDSLKRR